jgi:hypothetical protein
MIVARTDWGISLKHLELFHEPVEIRDETGKLLGVFVPANLERGEEIYARARASHNPEEMERRLREEGHRGLPYQEVLRRLQALAPTQAEREKLQAHIDRLAEEECLTS